MERMQASFRFEFKGEVSRTKLSPALMWRSIRFACGEVRKLSGLRTQWMVHRRKRSCEIIYERRLAELGQTRLG